MNHKSIDTITFRLNREQTKLLFGCYEKIDYNNTKTRSSLNILLKKAINQKNFKLDSSKLVIEIKETYNGCKISFSKNNECVLNQTNLFFSCFEDVIFAVSEMYSIMPMLHESSLIKIKDIFCLTINSKYDISKQLLHIEEFCIKEDHHTLTTTYIEEYGKILIKENAVSIINKFFLIKEP